MSSPSEAESAEERWSAFLDRVEEGLSEAMLLADGKALGRGYLWSAPTDLPPLPERAVSRVSEILKTQQALLDQLKTNRDQALKLRRFVQVDAAKGMHGGPYFIDAGA